MPVIVKKVFPYDDFRPSQYKGVFSPTMFDELMTYTKRIQPDVKERVRKYLVDGLTYAEIEPDRPKQSIYIRVRYYIQVGINAGFVKDPDEMKKMKKSSK